MSSDFGKAPYRACFYGVPQPLASTVLPSANEAALLRNLLEQFKNGNFSNIDKLRPFLSHSSFDLRQYGHQLFAHVCNHSQVEWFAAAFDRISDLEELHRVVFRLGETLSGNAIPLLCDVVNEYGDDSEVREHICLSMRILDAPDNRDCLDKNELLDLLERKRLQIVPPAYFYRGRPVFLGDVTKELVTAAMIANRERRNVILFRQSQVLSIFSGLASPIQHGQAIFDEDMNRVFDYVEKLSKLTWQVGTKYFYGHAVPSG
jgi:hypothetical protein